MIEALVPVWVQVSSIVAPFIAGGVALMTYFFFKHQHQANGLFEAFKILNTEQHRNARTTVYRLYRTYLENRDLNIFFVDDVRRVRADYDQMGTMIRARSINKKQFLRQYGASAYLCWKFLEDHIQHERELRNFLPFMTDFEWLVQQAIRYWQSQGEDLSKIRIHEDGVVIS